MYASRVCGAEDSSYTRPRATSRTAATTKSPKGGLFASGLHHRPFRVRSPAMAARAPRIERRTRIQRLDQGAWLAAVNGHTCPADPAGARRHEERNDRPDLFGAAKPPKR